MESALYGIFTLVGFVSEISLVRVKIPYARPFHEVSIFNTLKVNCG